MTFADHAGRVRKRGRVERVASEQLAYVHSGSDRQAFPFRHSNVWQHGDRTFAEMYIGPGSDVEFLMDASGIVSLVFPLGTVSPDPLSLTSEAGPSSTWRSDDGGGVDSQLELLVEAVPEGERTFSESPLSAAARGFRKFIDTSRLLPGDLVLFREHAPEGDSKLTLAVQDEGGYPQLHARWTHVAMYLGDDLHVVEATTDNYFSGSVRMTHLDKFCTGQYVMRFRRPKAQGDMKPDDRWKLCIRALTRLRLPYDLKAAVLLWYNVVVRGRKLSAYPLAKVLGRSVFCSTLYSDAYTEVTGLAITKLAGVCVPALLSGSALFDDIPPAWVQIR